MILSSCLTAVVLASSLVLTGPVPEETVVDDLVVERVPADTRMSTFDFEFDDVTFRSQVWNAARTPRGRTPSTSR